MGAAQCVRDLFEEHEVVGGRPRVAVLRPDLRQETPQLAAQGWLTAVHSGNMPDCNERPSTDASDILASSHWHEVCRLVKQRPSVKGGTRPMQGVSSWMMYRGQCERARSGPPRARIPSHSPTVKDVAIACSRFSRVKDCFTLIPQYPTLANEDGLSAGTLGVHTVTA